MMKANEAALRLRRLRDELRSQVKECEADIDEMSRDLGATRKKLADLQLRIAALNRAEEALMHPAQRRVDTDDGDPGQETP